MAKKKNEEANEASTETKTRKRRTALELFVDQKKEHAARVAGIQAQIEQLQSDLVDAQEAEKAFIENARAALGL